MFHVKHIDVVVVGGGHAGIEASLASARMGCSTVLITLDASKIGEMSCNPSIGGIGKGQLAKEIDALGGAMGETADITGIQFKRLNTRKGSAVQSTRCQSDKKQYSFAMQKRIAETPNLTVLSAEVKGVLTEGAQVKGLLLETNGERSELLAKAVVITAGTFMKGLIHCGDNRSQGGRFGEKPSVGLSDTLRELGFRILRLKTGTPPRLLRDTIDWSKFETQLGDEPKPLFSFWGTEPRLEQVACYLSYTSPAMHQAIQENLSRSPLYSGKIQGIGPRYCPSIEDKVVKFPDKTRHPLFFEPEALDSDWIYPNGISTSLPADVQERFVRTIPGCEEVKFARYGYAVEYDCVDPVQLQRSLQSLKYSGLFFAGQVNGTSGYEEAGAQGLLAGINAGLLVRNEPAFIPDRSESYIGVMVDDLTRLGVTEPYRMFTSRSEYRLSLREDNADLRLSPYGRKFGLLDDQKWAKFVEKKKTLDEARVYLSKTFVKALPDRQKIFASWGTAPLNNGQSLAQILRRPEVAIEQLRELPEGASLPALSLVASETLEIEVKYDGYISMQKEEIARLHKLRELLLPKDFPYQEIDGLSLEVREKLNREKPASLADASRISGVTPAALTTLLFHLRGHKNKKKKIHGPAHTSI